MDEFGQYIHDDWKGKIHSKEELMSYEEKEKRDLKQYPRSEEWNEYGGWKAGPQLKATGHFRVEKNNGKWCFVDPKGRLFWSQDINGIGSGSHTLITGRKHFFKYLPEEGTTNARFYSERRDGQTFSFYDLNLFSEVW